MNVETQDRLVRRLQDKLKPLANGRALFETENLDDAEVVVVSYGITSRVAQRAIQLARAQGIRAGKFRIISAWPFPDQHIRELAGRVKAFVVPELNLGQMVHEVERAAAGRAKVIPVTHAGGSVHNPEVILQSHCGGSPMNEATLEIPCESRDAQSGRAVPAHGPHAAHLVSGLRHRHHRQLLHPRPGEFQAQSGQGRRRLRHRLHRPRRRVRQPRFASTPPTAAPFPSPPASSSPIPSCRWWSTPAMATCSPSAATTSSTPRAATWTSR